MPERFQSGSLKVPQLSQEHQPTIQENSEPRTAGAEEGRKTSSRGPLKVTFKDPPVESERDGAESRPAEIHARLDLAVRRVGATQAVPKVPNNKKHGKKIKRPGRTFKFKKLLKESKHRQLAIF